jgi:LytS/YehU family sensor histidine kinase
MNRFWKYHIDQILFWTATVGFHMFTRIELINKPGFNQFILEIIIRNGLLAVLVYSNWSILVPTFARKKKIVAYIFLVLASLTTYAFLKNIHDVYLNAFVLGDETRQSLFYNIYYNFSIGFFYMAFHIAIQLSKEWHFQRELIQKMEVEKLSTELEYLKAQINPHFIFNSINTIYFQIDKENTLARESLSAFSEMLRYQLYECDGKEIPIEKELTYLKNYVALQRMRKDENYSITFEVSEQLTACTISPLLFIPFVENAFKYVSHHLKNNEVKIKIEKQDDTLKLFVFNTKEDKPIVNGYTGIGLKNVQRRLELLYKDRHQLKIENRAESYEVMLAIQVNKNSG